MPDNGAGSSIHVGDLAFTAWFQTCTGNIRRRKAMRNVDCQTPFILYNKFTITITIINYLRDRVVSVTVAWKDNTTRDTLVWKLEGDWTWDEVFAAQDEANALRRTVPHTVDVIGYFCSSSYLPQGAFTSYRRLYERRPSNHGLTILVGNKVHLKAMSDMFARLYEASDSDFAFAATLEEAYAKLEQQH